MTLPPYITGSNKNSFAAFTLSKRFPHIIESIIANNRLTKDQVNQLRELMEEILNGNIHPLKELAAEETDHWIPFMQDHVNQPYYETPFFKVEAYIYRRIAGIMNYFSNGQDPFLKSKMDNIIRNIDFISRLANQHEAELTTFTPAYFSTLLLAALWGNSADLSQIGNNNAATNEQARKNLLIDDITSLTAFIEAKPLLHGVDYIADNAGLELITDLFLIDYLLSSGQVASVTLHLKKYPTFVSDAVITDVFKHLEFLQTNEITRQFAARITMHIERKMIVLKDHYFWNSPCHFTSLPEEISASLSAHELSIFKGDANYRRFFEDREWDITTPVKAVLNYLPRPCLSIRTLKSEIMLGLSKEEVDRLYDEDKNWLVDGTYGVIMFVS